MIKLSKYNKEKVELIALIEELQDYLLKLDPLERLRRLPGYGEKYIEDLLEKIQAKQGVIILAKSEDKVLGFIAGIIEEEIDSEDPGNTPSKVSRILELIVSAQHRGKNIGTLLMSEIETHFKQIDCDLIRVEVFEPNHKTHEFYKKLGYNDRVIDMVKII